MHSLNFQLCLAGTEVKFAGRNAQGKDYPGTEERVNVVLMLLALLNFFFMMVAAVGPLYIAYRVRERSQRLFALAMLLGSFALIHACYHLFQFLGADFLADVVFYPLSAVLLLCFGIFYWKAGV